MPVRLARGAVNEAAELWVVRDRAVDQLDELVRHADDRLVARLAFAVAEAGDGGEPTVVVRARPSKLAPPVLVLDGVGYRSYLRLANLFLPVGTRLHPPLRRDAVARLLASDPTRVTWLAPRSGGGFMPESLPEESFRPLDQWVDYVLDCEHRPLEAWVRSARFDFEPFVCGEEEGARKEVRSVGVGAVRPRKSGRSRRRPHRWPRRRPLAREPLVASRSCRRWPSSSRARPRVDSARRRGGSWRWRPRSTPRNAGRSGGKWLR